MAPALPYLYFAATAASSIYSGVSQYQQGKAQDRAYDLQARQAEEAARQEASQIQAKSRRITALQRATFAASGAELSGTAFDVQRDSELRARTDTLAALTFGSQQAAALRTKGNMSRTAGRNALVSSGFDTAGSVLGAGYYQQTGEMPTWG